MDSNVMELVAPARVNLLGEHTDYTGGYVLPMAIPFATQATIRAGAAGCYSFHSKLFGGELTMLTSDRSAKVGQWTDYPVGVLRELQSLEIEMPPFVLELAGNVPFGAGLSSSASVEVASCLAMLRFAGKTLSTAEVATLCQRAENHYVGSPCGIMDQFVIAAGRAGHALMLNTRELTYELLPMNGGALAETCIVVCNSEVKHSVAAGEYGTRRKEAEEGQAAIRAQFDGVRDLGEATLEMLDVVKGRISPEAYKRAHHIVSENARVLQAREAMLAGNPVKLGQLMVEAHKSQRNDFQCSCDEIDFLVDIAVALEGCFGARMTGGGFGGCTVNLVKKLQAASFSEALKGAYRERWGIEAETYVCEAVDGAMARNGFAEGAL